MKKIINFATLLYLLTHTQYNITMHNENNFITDKKQKIFAINHALQTLQPSLNETVQERYNELIQEYEENLAPIVASMPKTMSIRMAAEQKLQNIEDAYQVMQQYDLENKLTSEIVEENKRLFIELQKEETIESPPLPKPKMTVSEALGILSLPSTPSLSLIKQHYKEALEEEDGDPIPDDEKQLIQDAYEFLVSKMKHKRSF